MSSLSALLSAYGESDGEPEDATPSSTAANGRPEGKAEAPELSALDLLFQRSCPHLLVLACGCR